MPKKGPKDKSPPPPDNERCRRNDGKRWRCKHRRSEGESMCDYHTQYVRNKSGSAKKLSKGDFKKNSGRKNELKGGIKEVKSVELKSSNHSEDSESSSSYSRSVTSCSASFTSSEGPSIAKPSVVKSPVAKPSVVKPPVAKPSVVKTSAAKPSVVRPSVVKPVVKPSVANPSVVKTSAAKPSVGKPSVAEPSRGVAPSTSIVPGAKRPYGGGDSDDVGGPIKMMAKRHHFKSPSSSEMNTDANVPSYNEIFERCVALKGDYKKWEIFDLVNNVEMRRHFSLLEDDDARAYVEYHVRKMRREDAQS